VAPRHGFPPALPPLGDPRALHETLTASSSSVAATAAAQLGASPRSPSLTIHERALAGVQVAAAKRRNVLATTGRGPPPALPAWFFLVLST